MGKYGVAAVRSATLLQDGCESAEEAWRAIAADVFSDAPEARDKVCPREAFFGLCAAGLVLEVSPNTCFKPSRSPNRSYAVTAVRLLIAEPELAKGSKIGLWRRVMKELEIDQRKKPNEQMDVVLALWEAKLINTSVAVNSRGQGLARDE